MVDQLSRHPAVFEFMIQRQVDPVAMPTDDPTIESPKASHRSAGLQPSRFPFSDSILQINWRWPST